jgi:hypothetical protein
MAWACSLRSTPGIRLVRAGQGRLAGSSGTRDMHGMCHGEEKSPSANCKAAEQFVQIAEKWLQRLSAELGDCWIYSPWPLENFNNF